MPSVTVPIRPEGPLIQLGVGVSGPRRDALVAAKLPVPQYELITGLVDTGASCTCIDCAVIQRLGIDPTGTVPMHTPSTGAMPATVNQFDVSLFVLMDANQVHASSLILPVIETDFSMHPFDCLIGRDVLARANMFYNGVRQTLVLSF